MSNHLWDPKDPEDRLYTMPIKKARRHPVYGIFNDQSEVFSLMNRRARVIHRDWVV